MNWLKSLFLTRRRFSDELIKSIQEKFEHFLKILDSNYRVLKIISDMEEKSQGEYLFDMGYIEKSRREINEGMEQLIAELNILSGDRYGALRERYREINRELDLLVTGGSAIEKDDYVVPFDMLGRERAFSVGSKNAQLGELKTNLGLPVPDGFAITAWAYKRFVEANNLQDKITEKISQVDIKSYSQLVAIGNDIRGMVTASEIPPDLSDAIAAAFAELKKRNPSARIAMRSSAIGEDTLFSFAGQYQSLLNVPPEKALDGYRSII
ncbi:MAG: PEP/pyruvate-binding domain-containing protein, partial [Candidatus Zixiibacteriota bacterium]